MDYSTGKIAFIFLAALVLAWAGARWLAWRYRAEMKALMSAPSAPSALPVSAPAPAAPVASSTPPGATPGAYRVTLAANVRAGWRVTLLLIGLSVPLALSSAALTLVLVSGESMFSVKRMAVLALVNLWPAIPAIGLLWRWSPWRVLAVLLGWSAFCVVVTLLRQIEPRPAEALLYVAIEVGPTMALVAVLSAGSVSRAAAPWLLPPLIGLVWASVAGIDVLWSLVERRSPLLAMFPSSWVPHGVMALFAVLPWLLAWWPLRWLGRALGRAYARKRLSELMVLFTAVWALVLLVQALSSASDVGLAGALMLLPLLWIPLVMAVVRRFAPHAGRPPTLLVLRVFQHDAQIQALFDHVIERWRLTGNTVLIAGTDLLDRTLDAEDIFTFLDGRLAQRFIGQPADVAPRLAAFDDAPDADGRYRVNECYCHDTTWQQALAALEQRSDVVLMDLRGFQAHNAGCIHELRTLAGAQLLARVVVLVDAQTDRGSAEAAAAGAPSGRFSWLDAATIDAAKRNEVLRSLFAR